MREHHLRVLRTLAGRGPALVNWSKSPSRLPCTLDLCLLLWEPSVLGVLRGQFSLSSMGHETCPGTEPSSESKTRRAQTYAKSRVSFWPTLLICHLFPLAFPPPALRSWPRWHFLLVPCPAPVIEQQKFSFPNTEAMFRDWCYSTVQCKMLLKRFQRFQYLLPQPIILQACVCWQSNNYFSNGFTCVSKTLCTYKNTYSSSTDYFR